MPPAGKPTGMRFEERLLDVSQAWEARESARVWQGEPPSVGGILSPERTLSRRQVGAVPGAPTPSRRVAAPTEAIRFARTRGARAAPPRGDDTEYTHHPNKAHVIGGNRSFRSRAGLTNPSTRPAGETEYGQAYAARAKGKHAKAVATEPIPLPVPEPVQEEQIQRPAVSEYSSR